MWNTMPHFLALQQEKNKSWGDYKQGQDDFWYNMYNEIQAVCF